MEAALIPPFIHIFISLQKVGTQANADAASGNAYFFISLKKKKIFLLYWPLLTVNKLQSEAERRGSHTAQGHRLEINPAGEL